MTMREMIWLSIKWGIATGIWITGWIARSGLLAIFAGNRKAAKAEHLNRLALLAEASGFNGMGAHYRMLGQKVRYG